MTFALCSLPSHALHFPEAADLEKDYRVSARKGGHPTDFFRKQDGDSASLSLEWSDGKPIAVRMEQGGEFDPDSFSALTSAYGNGAAWHESMTAKDPRTLKLYPGLQQEWILKGYGGEKGWLGSGFDKGRFFLVFREAPPIAVATVTGPLRLNAGLPAFLDTSSQWLHVPCKDAKDPAAGGHARAKATGRAGKLPACFSPDEDSRFRVRIVGKSPLTIDVWMEDGESAALKDIQAALKSVPDASQAEYAKDLSQMLLGEAQMFLVKLAQRLPQTFNWPSWQLQDFRAGQIPAREFLPLVRRQENPGDSLPAFRFRDERLNLSVDLDFRGMFHMAADERGNGKDPMGAEAK